MAALLALTLALPRALAINSAGSGYWTNGATWSGGTVPSDGQDAVILNAHTVTVDTSSASLNSLTVNAGGILTFAGWNTVVTSTTVQVNGTMTHLPQSATATNSSGQWVPDARVYVVCSNFTLAAGATNNVNGKGYAGGALSSTGKGPGGGGYGSGNNTGAGGSHAGYGQRGTAGEATRGPPYGTLEAPIDPGSGGGGNTASTGGAGGGVVRIDATGIVTIDGSILANGVSPSSSAGGGSGGSIYITCRVLQGTGGTLSVKGADQAVGSWGAGGSAGRVAVVCNASAQNSASRAAVSISAQPGWGTDTGWTRTWSSVGTVYLNADHAVPENWTGSASLSGFPAWTPSQVTVNGDGANQNSARIIMEGGPSIAVANNLNVGGGGRLDLYNANLTVGADVLISNASVYAFRGTNLNVRPSLGVNGQLRLRDASFWIYAGTTNTGSGTNYDVTVSVGGTLDCGSNSWIYPCSDSTNGGAVRFSARHVSILATNAGFNANGLGYGSVATNDGFGPGKGKYKMGGGGYGGVGASGSPWDSPGAGGSTYGSSNALPFFAGSAGGGNGTYPGSPGGGLIWIEAQKTFTLNGVLTANAIQLRNAGGDLTSSGKGSGGGIFITCSTFAGSSNALMQANGADGIAGNWEGAGGGGRIAVWACYRNAWHGTQTVNRGISANNEQFRTLSANGTIFWGQLQRPGTLLIIH